MSYWDYLENRIKMRGKIYSENYSSVYQGRRSGTSLKQINVEQLLSNKIRSLEDLLARCKNTLLTCIICESNKSYFRNTAVAAWNMTGDILSLATPAIDKLVLAWNWHSVSKLKGTAASATISAPQRAKAMTVCLPAKLLRIPGLVYYAAFTAHPLCSRLQGMAWIIIL